MSDAFGLNKAQRALVREILLTAKDRIEQVAVFGSRAQGRQRHNSDLDLVLYGSADEAVCDRLWTLFQESCLPFSVDVQSYASIKYPPLRAHIDAVARPWFVRTSQGLEEEKVHS
ncbi:Polymerase nucleotidyl transferase domain-containing protein [Candidatus Electronema halotolerans]|jgi:predicted nucleotidyltransferase